MPTRKVWGLILVTAATVVVTDLTFRSTLLRTLAPVIIMPADGAITNAPVTVRWEGSDPMLATLSGNGIREELGARNNPFELDRKYFPRPGQYRIELRSPALWRFVRAERRFLVRQPVMEPEPSPTSIAPTETPDDVERTLARLQSERDRMQAENAELFKKNTTLRLDNRDLDKTVEELDQLQERAFARLAVIESQQSRLSREHVLALQENQYLRARIASLPDCTTWGYLSYPRPQTVPPTRRIVVVSNTRGHIFRDHMHCEQTRRADRSAASQCICVGSVWE